MLADDDIQSVQKLNDAYRRLVAELGRVIVGQQQVIEELLIAMFARGHCLLVGVPGLAKTLLIRTLADTLSLKFSRIQFTPDLMPSDITGTEVIQEDKARACGSSSSCRARSSPTSSWPTRSTARRPRRRPRCWRRCRSTRSRSGGTRHRLDEPFFVLATQNPIEQEGTLSAARSAAGPLHVQHVRRLSRRGGRVGDRPADDGRRYAHARRRRSRPRRSWRCRRSSAGCRWPTTWPATRCGSRG